jgi:hypothetical protein
MTSASAVTKVKNRFNIPTAVTALDTIITSCVADAIDLLNGYAYVSSTATINLVWTDTEFTVAANRKVTALTLDDGLNKPVTITEWFQKGLKVFLRTSLEGTVTYYFDTPYDDAALTNLPTEFNQPFLNLCYSEFAGFLAGDRSAYSQYSQSAGARAVDNMRELAQFYEQKADRQFAKVEVSEGAM